MLAFSTKSSNFCDVINTLFYSLGVELFVENSYNFSLNIGGGGESPNLETTKLEKTKIKTKQ
jgi:hypothetical protein